MIAIIVTIADECKTNINLASNNYEGEKFMKLRGKYHQNTKIWIKYIYIVE